jgi:O-antigen/teichoic acid export membrane protein
MLNRQRPSLEHQLLFNQVWETVAFIAKAAFMLGLTPWMIRKWGAAGYGEFALASSAFIFLSLFDFGIRGRTRVALSKELGGEENNSTPVLATSVLAFGAICLVVLSLTGAVTICHGWSHLLGIRREHESLLFVTTALTLPYMSCSILLEPLVVRGSIGKMKSATAVGWIVAIPLVGLTVWRGGSVVSVTAVWLGVLLFANLYLLASHFREVAAHLKGWHQISRHEFLSVFRESFFFTVASLTWAAKSHGLTLLLGAQSGPTTAGTFFIILRLSEIVSALGAISFDVALAALPQCRSAAERRKCFMVTWRYTLLFSLPCAAGIAVFGPAFFVVWLKAAAPLGWTTGIWIAGLGLAIAANRFITYVALGFGAGRVIALCGPAEIAITLIGVSFLQPLLGLTGSLSVVVIAVIAYLPAVWVIREKITTQNFEPDPSGDLQPLVPGVSLAAAPVRENLLVKTS